MKKINYNVILFVFAMLFILTGIGRKGFIRVAKSSVDMVKAKIVGNEKRSNKSKQVIESTSNEDLKYHDLLIDINSVKENLLGTRVIIKDDAVVVKADSGSLVQPVDLLDKDSLSEVVKNIRRLKDIAEENNAGFLYCAAPSKEYYEQLPENVANFAKSNYDGFIHELQEAQVPVLDYAEVFKENNLTSADIYYFTDHHWRARSGFLAYTAICQELSMLYGFRFDDQYTDLNNYSVSMYKNWFLGSKGKKTGRYFDWRGADDFELITPLFETNLVEEQPYKNRIRRGAFSETVLYLDNMRKDYYKVNSYVSYCGGDFRLQIISNNLLPEGKRILLVRDSFACVVAPFLALQTSELCICDIRDYDYFVGTKTNISEYIEEMHPDYVIVLYQGVYSMDEAHGRYDFFTQ